MSDSLKSQPITQLSSSAVKSKSKSKRKQKRKRKSAKGPTPPVCGEERRNKALAYLHHWETNRSVWSFRKILQYWLLNNMYDKKQIGKSDFKVLVRYLDGLKGFQRERLVTVAQEIIDNYTNDKTIRLKYKRAKKIVELKTE